MRTRRIAVLAALVATTGLTGTARGHWCDVTSPDVRPEVAGVNDGRCGTVVSHVMDESGRLVAGQCSYRATVSGGTATVLLVGESVTARALPSSEDPAGRFVPAALTTRCLLRTVPGQVVLDVTSGSIGLAVDVQHTAATVTANLVPFVVCVESTAVYGDFDAVWTPLACVSP